MGTGAINPSMSLGRTNECVRGGPVFHICTALPSLQDAENYTASGLLRMTDYLGVHECGEQCRGKKCGGNKQVGTSGCTFGTELLVRLPSSRRHPPA